MAVRMLFGVQGSSDNVATFRSSIHNLLKGDTLPTLLSDLKNNEWQDRKPIYLHLYGIHVYASPLGRRKDQPKKDALYAFGAKLLERMEKIAGKLDFCHKSISD